MSRQSSDKRGSIRTDRGTGTPGNSALVTEVRNPASADPRTRAPRGDRSPTGAKRGDRSSARAPRGDRSSARAKRGDRSSARAPRDTRSAAREAGAKQKRRKSTFIVVAVVAAVLVIGACFLIYDLSTGMDLKDIRGTWYPINSRDGEMTIRNDMIRLTPEMDEKKIEKNSSGFTVTDTDTGATEKLSFSIDDIGFLWKVNAFDDAESTGGYSMAEAFYNDSKLSDKVEYAFRYFGEGDEATRDYIEYLLGTWSSEAHSIKIEKNQDGILSIDYDLPVIEEKIDYDESDDGVFCSADGFYIWTKGTFLISMIPIGDDTCAAFMYGDGSTATFTREQ